MRLKNILGAVGKPFHKPLVKSAFFWFHYFGSGLQFRLSLPVAKRMPNVKTIMETEGQLNAGCPMADRSLMLNAAAACPCRP
jgi:hypothetical protein